MRVGNPRRPWVWSAPRSSWPSSKRSSPCPRTSRPLGMVATARCRAAPGAPHLDSLRAATVVSADRPDRLRPRLRRRTPRRRRGHRASGPPDDPGGVPPPAGRLPAARRSTAWSSRTAPSATCGWRRSPGPWISASPGRSRGSGSPGRRPTGSCPGGRLVYFAGGASIRCRTARGCGFDAGHRRLRLQGRDRSLS